MIEYIDSVGRVQRGKLDPNYPDEEEKAFIEGLGWRNKASAYREIATHYKMVGTNLLILTLGDVTITPENCSMYSVYGGFAVKHGWGWILIPSHVVFGDTL